MMMVGFCMGGWLIAMRAAAPRAVREYAADITRRRRDRRDHRRQAVVLGDEWRKPLLPRRPGVVRRVSGRAAAVILNGWRKRSPAAVDPSDCCAISRRGLRAGTDRLFHRQRRLRPPYHASLGVRFPQGLPPSTAENMTSLFGIPMPAGTDPHCGWRCIRPSCTRSRSCSRCSHCCGGGGSSDEADRLAFRSRICCWRASSGS